MLLVAKTANQKRIELSRLAELAKRDSARKSEQQHRIDLLKKTAAPHPVTISNDTLFYLYTRLGSFNASERAAAISARLKRIV